MSLASDFEQKFEQEKVKTKECLNDVRQLLSHDTCSTRRQLIQVLQGCIDLIQAEIGNDRFFEEVKTGGRRTLYGLQPEKFELPGNPSKGIPALEFKRDPSGAPGLYRCELPPDFLRKRME